MAGLTRRAFLATTAAVAGSFALPNDLLARAAAAPLTPSTAPSTLQQTIRLSSTANLLPTSATSVISTSSMLKVPVALNP